MPYSPEMRRDVLEMDRLGATAHEISIELSVSKSWVRRVKQEFRETGKTAAQMTRNRKSAREDHADWLEEKVKEQPDVLLRELVGLAAAERDWKTSDSRLSEALRELTLTQKKTLIATERSRPDVVDKTAVWVATVQPAIDPDRLVFLDETWAKDNMTRTHGRSMRGTPLVESVPGGRWKTTTFLGAMRSSGFIAPLCIDGGIDGRTFLSWVKQHLIASLSPGDLVVMNNLSSRKVQGVREAIESVGAKVLYLPPYSPDLNPIEFAFAKFKRLLRDGAERTTEKLWQLCGKVLDLFPGRECGAYIKHCGYRYV